MAFLSDQLHFLDFATLSVRSRRASPSRNTPRRTTNTCPRLRSGGGPRGWPRQPAAARRRTPPAGDCSSAHEAARAGDGAGFKGLRTGQNRRAWPPRAAASVSLNLAWPSPPVRVGSWSRWSALSPTLPPDPRVGRSRALSDSSCTAARSVPLAVAARPSSQPEAEPQQ